MNVRMDLMYNIFYGEVQQFPYTIIVKNHVWRPRIDLKINITMLKFTFVSYEGFILLRSNLKIKMTMSKFGQYFIAICQEGPFLKKDTLMRPI